MIHFTDLHVQLLSQALLNPGERVISKTVLEHTPWWMMLPGIGKLIPGVRVHLLIATTDRMIIVTHKKGFIRSVFIEEVTVLPWENVQTLQLCGWFKNSLRIAGRGEAALVGGRPVSVGKPFALKAKIPHTLFMQGSFDPLVKNKLGAKGVVEARVQAQRLSAPPQPAGQLMASRAA